MTLPSISLDHFRTLVDGLDHPEGVAAGPQGEVFAGGEAGQVYHVRADGSFEIYANTHGFCLGLCLDGDGAIYVCDLHHAALMRVAPGGGVTTYSQGTADRPMVTPNYPVFDVDGNLYVSDSGDWEEDNGCIFVIEPGGRTRVLTEATSNFPNGLAISPDGAYLYIVLSLAPSVVRLPIDGGHAVGPAETVVELDGYVPDGLAFDSQGTLYISCYAPDTILGLSAAGELEVVAEDPRRVTLAAPTNIAFCGADRRDLVVASLGRWHLATTRVAVPGSPLNYPSEVAS